MQEITDDIASLLRVRESIDSALAFDVRLVARQNSKNTG